MDLSIILSSFTLLFLAEMGDKSQLIAMTLAHSYRLLPVIAGVLAAFLVLNLLAVLAGEALFRYVPQQAVLLTAGLLFLFFAYRSWRDSTAEEEEDTEPGSGKGALVSSVVLIFVADLC
jgi:putative Ca2+/H+ antiporter (TMEM165/GDT1 family)